MQKWEYMLIKSEWNDNSQQWELKIDDRIYPASETTNIMNSLGDQGWELVAPLGWINTRRDFAWPSVTIGVTYSSAYTLFFKRPKA